MGGVAYSPRSEFVHGRTLHVRSEIYGCAVNGADLHTGEYFADAHREPGKSSR